MLDNNEQLHGKVFASPDSEATTYVVVWPKEMFSCEEVRELTEEDYGKGKSKTRTKKKPTMKEAFGRAVLYYKIYFLKLDEEMNNFLSEADCRSVVTAATQALIDKFDEPVIQKTRSDLFQYAEEMLEPVGKLILRDTPRNSCARDVVELYLFVAKHTTCFPWMVLSEESRKHYLQQQLAKISTEIKQGNPKQADSDDANFELAKDTDNEIFQQFERVVELAVSTLWLIHK